MIRVPVFGSRLDADLLGASEGWELDICATSVPRMPSVERAIAAVDAAIEEHHSGSESAPFSSKILASVRRELERMAMSPGFQPTYPRFVLDWPDAAGPLGKQLLEISYLRAQGRRKRG